MSEINWEVIIPVSIVLMLATFFIFFRGQVNKSAVLIDEEEFSKNLRKGQLIDLRKKDEYEAGHINGARHIPMATLNRSLGKIRKDLPVYLYCANEKVSKRATLLLASKGYDVVFCLKGGIGSWTKPLKTKK